jgi:ubiquinone/menaquinone biosynthesis C-methylase UbiE
MDYYNTIAEGYDELHSEEQARKFKLILDNFEFAPDSTVLDVGCGSGLSACFIDPPIIGADPAGELLKLARSRLWQVARCRAEDLPFKEGSFDNVIAVTAVHNFDDHRAGLAEIARVTKSSAVITILKQARNYDDIMDTIQNIFHSWEKKKIEEDEFDDILILFRN